jgi:quercetin dioxygenase-like cupin family protein
VLHPEVVERRIDVIAGHYLDKELQEAPQVAGTQGAGLRWLTDEDCADFFYMRHVVMEKGGTIGLHDHPYEHQIFILKGKGKCTVGEEEYELTEGCYALIPGGVIHGFENIGEGTLEFICCINRV